MGEALAKLMKRSEPEEREELSAQESNALENMRSEAKRSGATLLNNGEGGLSPSLVLGVMRRDRYECKRCGKKKNLTLHHKGHLQNPVSKWLSKKGHSNDPNNLVVVCGECHDGIHEEDRKEE